MVDIFNTANKYKTVYADPPWWEVGGSRGANQHYGLMKTKDIIALPIKKLADPTGCHLYLWVTNNFLKDGLSVMEAWGFRYITTITWMKTGNFGLGQYYRGMTEHCLFGSMGKLPYKIINNKRVQGVTSITAPRREHSRKPNEMRSMIEFVSYAQRIELFAREKFEGWDCWGNETPILEPVQMDFLIRSDV